MSHAHALQTETVDDLLTMVKCDPHRPGPSRGRLVDFEVPVWAIILHLQSQSALEDAATASEADIADAAAAYRVSEQAVRAAIAYYVANRRSIDALLLINAEGFDED